MLPPERPGQPAPPDLAARREGLAAAAAARLWRTDPPPSEQAMGGVRCLIFDPADEPRGTVVHFHGGAFRIGMPEQVAPFAAGLAQRCSVSVICPAYRLAPEHPFPAALNDCLSVLKALSGSAPVILSGDSAGGGLAASLATQVRPAGLALLSPWLDLRVSAASYAQNAATDPLFSAEAAREAASLYLQGHSANDPLASPLLGDLSDFPPTFINVGAPEVLRDDACMLNNRLIAAGVPVELDVVPDMDHVAVTRDLTLPGAAHTFDALSAFIDRLL